MRRTWLFAGCAVIAASLTAGCSILEMTSAGNGIFGRGQAPARGEDQPASAATNSPAPAAATLTTVRSAGQAPTATSDRVTLAPRLWQPRATQPAVTTAISGAPAAPARIADRSEVQALTTTVQSEVFPQGEVSPQSAGPAQKQAAITVVADRTGVAAESAVRRNGKPAAPPTVGERIASAALGDGELGKIRGGLSVGPGVIVNFAFQEATFVNHNLAQSIVVPTITVSPGSTTAVVGGAAIAGTSTSFSPGSVAAIGNTAAQLNVPSVAVQSVVNNGMTSIVSSIGGGGVTNLVGNTANNQLIQQTITANIGISGLSQAIQQGVASTVLSRVRAATSQFR